MNWNHDLSQAPRGKMVPYTRKGKDGPVQSEQYRKEYILAVDEHGVVSQSYWIPPRYTQSGGLLEGNRWSGFNPGVDPIAWAPWPEYHFQAKTNDEACETVSGLRRAEAKAEASDGVELVSRVTFPKPGEVYTIRDIFTATRTDGEVVVSVRLVEVTNDPQMRFSTGFVGEIGFNAECFRPLVERKTDISVFKAMLNPSREGVPA